MDEGNNQCTNKIDTDKYKCAPTSRRAPTHTHRCLTFRISFIHEHKTKEINALKFVLSGLSVYFVLLLSSLSQGHQCKRKKKKKQKQENKKKWMGKIYLTHNYTLK